ncbi:hypothetical protein [Iningainema tapete]|uniref:Uncharacterized protein n=1 Tax=Iningainema tapete BLCC-T55 TaxID=2748662 RepID=A0A8J6XQR9_9CYAN|nr:hypothetical protein [Iningainema tapete]MBD2775671.1 hypothetical protein [Iningainema tapete BLCC-T55]
MNKKLKLALLASPTVFASLMSVIGVVNPAHATPPVIRMKDGQACIRHPHISYKQFVCTRTTQTNQASSKVYTTQQSDKNVAMLNFSAEESDKAIALFGCDCPYCMNAFRALQGGQPMVY